MPVRLSDYLTTDAIATDLKAGGKRAVVEDLAALVTDDLPKDIARRAVETLLAREELGSTGTGEGVAIPHGKLEGMPGLRLAFGRHPKGVDFEAVDDAPVHLFFLVLAPTDAPGIHLKLLARIARIARQPELRQQLLAADGPSAVLKIFTDADDQDEL